MTMTPSTRRSTSRRTSSCSRFESSSRLAARTNTLCSRAKSSTARWTAEEYGLLTSSRSSPIVCVRPSARRRLGAAGFGRYPSLTAGSGTRSTRSGATVGTSLKTRDTVLTPTPARAATSRIVARSRRPSPTPSSVTPVLSLSEGPARLEGGVAAVDHEDGTCHEAGCGTGQEEYGRGYLLG